MRLTTARAGRRTVAARVDDDRLVALPAGDVAELLRNPQWRELAAAADGPALDTADLAPVVVTPGKVICCGHNYRSHIGELGHEPPAHPNLFAKWADTLTGPRDPIALPAGVAFADWEAELAVVVGAPLRDATRAEARAAIAGYTVANDVSARDWQRRASQWLTGKAIDATTPVGPVLVTADELDPADGLALTCHVNGELMQAAATDELVFDAAALLAAASAFTALAPGDLILTGTPGGVGAAMSPPRGLADGDEVVCAIDGIGVLRNRVTVTSSTPRTSEGAVHA